MDATIGDSRQVESSDGYNDSVDVVSVSGRNSDPKEASTTDVRPSSSAGIPSAAVLLQQRRRTSVGDVSAGRIGRPTFSLR